MQKNFGGSEDYCLVLSGAEIMVRVMWSGMAYGFVEISVDRNVSLASAVKPDRTFRVSLGGVVITGR